MPPITSMYDFECRVQLDNKYKALAVYAHETAGWADEAGLYEDAKKWMDTWLMTDGAKRESCGRMISYLNNRMLEMKQFSNSVNPKGRDIIIPNYGPEFHPCTCGCNLLLNDDGDEVGINPDYKSKNTEA